MIYDEDEHGWLINDGLVRDLGPGMHEEEAFFLGEGIFYSDQDSINGNMGILNLNGDVVA